MPWDVSRHPIQKIMIFWFYLCVCVEEYLFNWYCVQPCSAFMKNHPVYGTFHSVLCSIWCGWEMSIIQWTCTGEPTSFQEPSMSPKGTVILLHTQIALMLHSLKTKSKHTLEYAEPSPTRVQMSQERDKMLFCHIPKCENAIQTNILRKQWILTATMIPVSVKICVVDNYGFSLAWLL